MKNIKKLPDTEFEVMQAIWKCTPPVSRIQIEEILKDTHPMASTTLFTLLTRLSEKEFIRIEKVNRSADYYPLITQEEYLADQGNRFFKKMCQGNLSMFANALCDSGLTKEEIAELKELLGRDD